MVSIVNCDHTRLIDYLLVVLKEFVPTHFHKLTSRPVLTPFSCAVRTNLLSQLQNMKQSLSQIMIDFPALKTVNSGAAPAAKHLRADSTTTAFTLESGHSRCSSIDSCWAEVFSEDPISHGALPRSGKRQPKFSSRGIQNSEDDGEMCFTIGRRQNAMRFSDLICVDS